LLKPCEGCANLFHRDKPRGALTLASQNCFETFARLGVFFEPVRSISQLDLRPRLEPRMIAAFLELDAKKIKKK
jgi:hypothetical protein